MTSESLPEHIRRPHLRPIQPIPVKDKSGKPFVALRDPAMLTNQTMVLPLPAMQVVQLFRGERSVEEIAEQLKGEVRQFVELAKGLDKLGLLWGPTFEKLEAQAREKLQAEGAFPVRATMNLGSTEQECRSALKEYFQQTEDPELEGSLAGIVAPHLDYERGWPNYAAAYYALQDAPAPDRVVILGTNHYGVGDGVVLTEFGFSTPLGRCPADKEVIDRTIERLGRPIIVDQLDHLSEHSVELQLPWIQYCWGNVPIVAVLFPDPLEPMIAEDGQRATREQFVDAFSEVLESAGGSSFFVASGDLSHVGPQFGEPRPVDEQRRFDVERIDREMMAKFLTGDPEEFLSAMRWSKNPTHWCSIGNMTALLALARPQTIELIDYRQAFDDPGMVMITCASMALTSGDS